MDTSVRISSGLVLKNPLLSASGTFAYGEEFSRIMDLKQLGGVVTKGLSLLPREGNPTPRVYETPCGLINAIGLENIGVDAFLEEKLPFLSSQDTEIIVNFFGTSEEEYVLMAEKLDVPGVSALEMNVSCPNIKKGGIEFGKDPQVLSKLTALVRGVTSKPLIVKLSPMVTSIAEMALAAQEGGADALTCCNTLPAMAIDEKTMKPVLGNVTGGLSGPAIKPFALRNVWEVCRQVRIPVIASGGIANWKDLVQFLLAGATAAEIGSASLRDPWCFQDILEGLMNYMQERNLSCMAELIGKLMLP
ncbi:MAG: dihydroorotate dehydrogenase [Desulfomonilia bacterium]